MNKKPLLLLVVTAMCFAGYTIGSAQMVKEYLISDYGAINDGKTLSTESIQNTIDIANRKGGGKVIVPEGTYLIGTIELKSNVELILHKDATLLGSTNPFHYKSLEMKDRPESPKRDDYSQLALIVAYNAENILISGKGTIDGQGRTLALNIDSLHHTGIVIDPDYNNRRKRPNEKMRPKLIRFSMCKNVKITDVNCRNSACWGLSLELCDKLVLDSLNIFNRAYWNNDGMDITDCKNVSITNCTVNSADDGICLKSYYPGYYNDSVLVANCTIRSGASAIKFGTASYGGFKNVIINNIKVFDTYRSALALECVDGGIIENIRVSNVLAENTGNAIFIRLGHRDGAKPGVVRNIHISNVKVKVPFARADIDYDIRVSGPSFHHNPFPSSITGIPGHYVQGIELENIEISYPGRASKGQAYLPLSRLNMVPEKIKDYPEFSMFGELPAWGFYVRHAKGIRMHNVTLKLDDVDFRPAFVFDDVSDIGLKGIELPENKQNGQVVLKSYSGFEMEPQNPKLIKILD